MVLGVLVLLGWWPGACMMCREELLVLVLVLQYVDRRKDWWSQYNAVTYLALPV